MNNNNTSYLGLTYFHLSFTNTSKIASNDWNQVRLREEFHIIHRRFCLMVVFAQLNLSIIVSIVCHIFIGVPLPLDVYCILLLRP